MKRALTAALLSATSAIWASSAGAQTILFDDFENYTGTGFPDLGVASGGLWSTGYNGGNGQFYTRWSNEAFAIRPDGGGGLRWAGAGSTGGDIWSTRELPGDYSNGILNVYGWIDSRSSDANTDNIGGFGLSEVATVNDFNTQLVHVRYRSFANNTLELDLPYIGYVTGGAADGTPEPSPEHTNTDPYSYNQWQHVRMELNIDTQKARLFKDANRADPNVDDWVQLGTDISTGPVSAIRYVSVFTARDGNVDDLAVTYTPGTGTNKWKVDADGNWEDAGNWTVAPPSGAGATANFTDAIHQPRTVTVQFSESLGILNFDNANRYTIAGPGTLGFDTVGASNSEINVLSGSHTVSAPVQISKPMNVNVAQAASVLSLSGEVSALPGVTITKLGAGNLEISNVRADGLTVNAGAVKVLANGTDSGTSRVQQLTIAGSVDAWDAALDLGNNSLIVDYSGSSPRATIANQIKNGYNQGLWNGNGIVASSAAADSTKALGYGEASIVLGAGGGTFSGQSVDGTAVLVKYTWAGDTNLDGQVDVIDLGNLATAWQTSAAWTGGDSNYDGFVDVIDLGQLATNWQAGVGNPLGPGSLDQALAAYGLPSVSVPEPASTGLIGLAAGLMASRKRRS